MYAIVSSVDNNRKEREISGPLLALIAGLTALYLTTLFSLDELCKFLLVFLEMIQTYPHFITFTEVVVDI